MTENNYSSYLKALAMKTLSHKFLCGICPTASCKSNLIFASTDPTVTCLSCDEQHKKEAIKDVTLSFTATGDIKVNGISGYVCKLLSPLLTRYGMTKDTGEAKLLSKMGNGEIFDCSRLSGRAFLIEPCNLNVPGYGCDSTGSLVYLAETLFEIKKANAYEKRLVPIHVDGDGHCLVHAISRALVGRELFWHALRENLQLHFQEKLDMYKMHFQDFIHPSEWQEIIDECKPDFVPREGELLGLRNIHIFGLANVLRRPIVLLDSIVGMRSSGDYSGVFLPTLYNKEECLDKKGQLNKPLCIAWSSSGRNHYIPLVGIEGRLSPRLPRSMLQKAWGMPVHLINEYIDFDENDCCTIGGNKLGDRYIRKLIDAMEKVYYKENHVQPSLVADTYQLLHKTSVVDSCMKPDTVMDICKQLIRQRQLYRCLKCQCLNNVNVSQDWITEQFNSQSDAYKQLEDVLLYPYKDFLASDINNRNLIRCEYCKENCLRLVNADCKVCYVNGDLVTSCHGKKYYWDGVFYNNLPQVLPLTLKWKNKNIEVKVFWFENESDPSLNSNAFEIGQQLVQKHFPGEFNTEALVNSLVYQILELTKIKDSNLTTDATNLQEFDTGDSSHVLPVSRKEKHFSTELERVALPERARILLQTLNSTIKSNVARGENTEPIVNDPQQPEQGIHSVEEKIETLLNALTKHEPSQPEEEPMEPASLTDHFTQTKSVIPKPCETQLPTSVVKEKCPSTKNIRLSTSTGQKVSLSLVNDVTFKELQALITKELDIPATRQKIRVGFPPRQLYSTSDTELVPLHHGDRLEVEILPEEECFDSDPEKSLLLAAHQQGKDVWSYIQEFPDFFHKGGIIYSLMQQKRQQVHGLHFTIPSLPGKTFCYSSVVDAVQICIKAFGHFDVKPGIECKVQQISQNLINPCHYPGNHSNSQVYPRHPKARPPFSGQGRSLISRRREPKLNLSSGKKDLVSLDTDVEHTNISSYQRLGPGFSILGGGGGEISNATNTSLEKIRALAANIDPHLDLTRDQEDLQEEKENKMETT